MDTNLDELKKEVILKLENYEASCKNTDGTWKSEEEKINFTELINEMTLIMREDQEKRNLNN
jgi:hypothetical protein